MRTSLTQKKAMADKMFKNALVKNQIKAQKYVKDLTKTDINKAIRDVKAEFKLQEIKNFIKGLLIQYDNDWEFIEEEVIMKAFDEIKGGRKNDAA